MMKVAPPAALVVMLPTRWPLTVIVSRLLAVKPAAVNWKQLPGAPLLLPLSVRPGPLGEVVKLCWPPLVVPPVLLATTW